jgi:hypothetical protein
VARVRPGESPERNAAHDYGKRLRGGVTAHARDDGLKHGQHHDLLDGALEDPDDRGSQKCRARFTTAMATASAAIPEGRIDAVVLGDTGQTQHVLCGLVLDDVDDVVDGNDADELVFRIDDGIASRL